MNRSTAFNTLAQDFKTWMAATYPAITVAFQDTEFVVPNPGGGPWVRWSMNWSGSIAQGVGNGQYDRHTGMIFVELFYPSGLGFKAVNEMADAVAAHYRAFSADTGKLKCGGNDYTKPTISTPPREPGWTRRSVDVPVRLTEMF